MSPDAHAPTAVTAESTSRFITAGGVRLHYHEAGEGPVLLCIHGGAPGAFGWGNFGQNMPALSAHYRTLVVDLPGYGQSDKPQVGDGRYSFYAQTFRAMLAELGIERAHVLGMATGGGAGIMMSLEFPELVDRMILVSSVGGMPIVTPSPTEGIKAIQSYYGGDGPSLERMRDYLGLVLHDQALVTDSLVLERYEASIDPDLMVSAPEGHGHVRRPTDEALWQRLQEITHRTLVVWGRDNRMQGYDNALFMLNRIPDVEVHLFGRTGLWVPFERAARFDALVTAFLDAA